MSEIDTSRQINATHATGAMSNLRSRRRRSLDRTAKIRSICPLGEGGNQTEVKERQKLRALPGAAPWWRRNFAAWMTP